MKRSAQILGLMCLLLLRIQAQISIETYQTSAYCNGTEKGSVGLTISGDTGPYSVLWDDNSTSMQRTNLKPGLYSYIITDSKNDVFPGQVQLMSCIQWTDKRSVETSNGTIAKTEGTDSGANSINQLPASENGYVSYIVASSQHFAFGLDNIEPGNTVYVENIKYAFLIKDKNVFILSYGEEIADVGVVNDLDELKIRKNGLMIQFLLNDMVLHEQLLEGNPNPLRAEISFLYESTETIENLRTSFFGPSLSIDVTKGDIHEDQQNSGYISISVTEGVGPFTYMWNTGSKEQMIYNLPPGDYRGVVYDANGDSLVVKRTIGNIAIYGQRENMLIKEDGLKKIDNSKISDISLNQYIALENDGWVEFKIKEINSEFNVLLREFNFVEGIAPVMPATINESEVVELTGSNIPPQNSPDYNSLNIVDDSHYPTSISVLKYKFTDGRSEISPKPVLTKEHGIICKNNNLYILNKGETLKDPIHLLGNDVIRLVKNGTSFMIYLNGNVVFLGTLTEPKNLAVDINLITPEIYWDYITSGGTVLLPRGTPGSCNDNNRNWVSDKLYDGLGNVVAETKGFVDDLGRLTQTQWKNETKNNVIAQQTIYDAFGRAVLKTLPAPTFQKDLCYFENFVKNQSNTDYDHKDFDVPNWTSNFSNLTPGEKSMPRPVDNTVKGSLGWYYSDKNNEEPFVPAASTPYFRTEPDITNPGSILRSSQAGLGLDHGSGHETYQFSMKAAGELYYFLGFMNSWRISDMETHFRNYSACRSMTDVQSLSIAQIEKTAIKKITLDENGNEAVVFFDVMGNMIGRCLSGSVDGVNKQVQTLYDYIDVSPGSLYPFVDIHLPEGCQSSLILEQPSSPYSGTITYDIINLKTGRCDRCGVTQSQLAVPLGAGYFRIKVSNLPTNYPSQLKISYQTNYYNFTANYYDRANRLRIVVPPQGIDYSGSALGNYNFNNGSIAKKFVSTGSGVVYGGAYPNIHDQPSNWELGQGTNSHEMSLNIPVQSIAPIHNFIVQFTGKNTSWTTKFVGEGNPTETYRTSGGESAVTGDIAKIIYPVDNTDEPYAAKKSYKEFEYYDRLEPLDPMNALHPTYPNLPPNYNSFMSGGTICSSIVMPVIITYQIVDQSNNPLSGVNNVTGYCTITQCSGNTTSYSRTWTFPPQNVHQLTNVNYSSSFTARLKIINLAVVHNIVNYPTGIPWGYYTDITTHFAVRSGYKPNLPNHTMTELFEYDSWGQLITAKKPDSGQTDYIYGPDGTVRAIQNAKQNVGGATNTDKFSYFNYDAYGRSTESGEYDRGLTSSSANIKFKNYREFLTDNTAPSVIINANNNSDITDVNRKKEVVKTYYDIPDANFISQTGLNPAQFQQEYLLGKVSWTQSDDKWTWYSYDELGRLKWTVNRYNNVDEAVSPSPGVTIKTFYYNYDYMGNVTEMHYQYHLPATTVSDKMKTEFVYDQDKRLSVVKSTIYGETTPKTKTNAEYFYYLHGPLKRKQLANNLQGIDYVYTINGWLKNINSPEMDLQHDPGTDGYSGIGKITHEDLFGMSLDYFEGDYIRTTANLQTHAEPLPIFNYNYDGKITSNRWQAKEPTASGMAYQKKQLIYEYNYDKKGQMLNAEFGTINTNHVYSTSGGGTSPLVDYMDDYRVMATYNDNGNIQSLTRNAYAAGANGKYMDDITYNYVSCTNKLNFAADAISFQPPAAPDPYYGVGFRSGQQTGNYTYDMLGELAGDNNEDKKYEYNSSGQITKISTVAGQTIVEYKYDEDGLRISKIAYDPATPTNITKTLYVRDADGDIIAVYDKPYNSNLFSIKEWNVYGDDRVATAYLNAGNVDYVYEITDHLGSARTTFKEGVKKSFSTGLASNSPDNMYLTDPYNSITTFYGSPVSSPIFVASNPFKAWGISSVKIPASPGDVMNADVFAGYVNNGSNPPTNGIRLWVELVDANGNIVTSSSSNVTGGGGNAFQQLTTSLTYPTSSPPGLFFRAMVRNVTTTQAYFDALNFNISGAGGLPEPEQLDVYNFYPHGSPMPGLTYHNSFGGRYGYQGQYAENDKEVDELFFELRNYNPLLGRFNSIDPYGQYHSPYMSMGNSHPNMIDPDGGDAYTALVGAGIGAAAGLVTAGVIDYTRDGKFNKGAGFYALWTAGGAATGAAVAGFGWDKPVSGRYLNNGIFDGWERNFFRSGNQVSMPVDLTPHSLQMAGGDPIPITLPQPTWWEIVASYNPVTRAISAIIWLKNDIDRRVASPEFAERWFSSMYEGMPAYEIISKFKKGSIRQVFPGEYLPVKWEQIVKDAQRGIKKAQTAKKLLTDSRFHK
jgi:RHS repeat-associated protein